MNPISFVRQLYSLDTLDSRFTTSSRTPLKSVDGDQGPNKSSKSNGRAEDRTASVAPPSRWNTPEFYFYYAVFILVVPQMFKAVIDVSNSSHPNYKNYKDLLSEGWIPGRKVDNSDAQYSGFRDNVPYLALVLVFHPLLRRLCNQVHPVGVSPKDQPNGRAAQANVRMRQRTTFDLCFALLFLTALHGVSILKILLILYVNFCIATGLSRSYIPPVTWVSNIAILFANELGHGYHLVDVVGRIVPSSESALAIAKTLDNYGGLMPRWEIFFNITVLRLISFNMDYYWSLDQRAGSPIEKKQLDPAALSERDRVSIPASSSAFVLHNYFAYVLYSPLYVAGPILTFNDYISQCRYPSPSLTSRRTGLYAIRFLNCLLTMELLLHYIYAVAISKSSPDWSTYTPFQLSMLGFFNLHIIWLKLLLPWRFFRLWSLLDGIDPPENVVRCMSDNYSVLAFWRGWHRSFNRWIVRYIYIPLGGGVEKGGSRVRSIANFLAVFTFVAMWHDINLRVLMWGWLITLFVLPEILGNILFPAKNWKTRPNAYRLLSGIGAVGMILMLMAANLVGFALGLDGLKGLVHGIVSSWQGIGFMVAACGALFVGVQVMFEVRAGELRKGINLKC